MQESFRAFKPGNWVVYLPQGNYCTIRSLSPNMVLQGALRSFTCLPEQVGKVKITADNLQVCGFEMHNNSFMKNAHTGVTVFIDLTPFRVHVLYKNDEASFEVEYIHEVQNAFYEITRELLDGNLYGVRET